MEGRRLEPPESSRAELLLAYLLLHPAPQVRQHLAFVLWPDSTESQALTNLRHQLHLLRRAIPRAEVFLEATRRTLGWRPDAPFWLDTSALEVMAGETDPPPLESVVDLYRGDLLAGSYDEWLVPHRDRLRNAFLQTLERIADLATEAGRVAEAIAAAEQLVRYDPVREDSYRMLMRLHFDNGDRARAMRAFHTCAAALSQQLGVEPSPATLVLHERLVDAAGPPQIRAGGEPVPAALIGRSRSWEVLNGAWEQAGQQPRRLVLVTGEAGIGKTRLVEELAVWCSHRGAVVSEARSYPAEGSLAFGLVTGWLRSAVYAEHLAGLDEPQRAELSRLLPELRAGPVALEYGDAGEQIRLFEAVARALAATGMPLLLIAEDLHWADRQSLQFLHYLVRSEMQSPLMVVGTARSGDFVRPHPLSDLTVSLRSVGRLNEIELERLSPDASASLAAAVSGRPLTPQQAERIFAESEGNPLFIVEAVRAGLSGTEPKGAVSPRIQGVIEMRVSQLSDRARSILGVASAVGREFSLDLLEAAAGAGREDLTAAMDELWRRRIVRESGSGGYDFSHDKIRDVVYRGLSPVLRRSHHRRIAAHLEEMYGIPSAGASHWIATHHEAAGYAARAAGWYERAAGEALGAYAGEQALGLLDRGLELAATLDDNEERTRLELTLLLTSLAPRSLLEGAVSAPLRAAQQRAAKLADRLEVKPPAPLVRSLAMTRLSAGDFDEARRLGTLLRDRGQTRRDAVLEVEGQYILGIAAFWKGRLSAARGHFEQGVQRYRPEHQMIHRMRYGLDQKVICLSRLGNTLWFLGYPQQGQQAAARALAEAKELGHRPSLATVAVFSCLLAFEEHDEEALRQMTSLLLDPAVNGVTLATQVTAAALSGYLEILDGRPSMGVGILRRALEEGRNQYSPGFHACLLRLLLEAESRAGLIADGLVTAAVALEFPDGVHLWEPEIRRIRADLLARSDAPTAEVEAELQRARDRARSQGSALLEIRSVTSLLDYRLGYGGDVVEVRRALQAAIGALDGTGDCRDLIKARAALAGTQKNSTLQPDGNAAGTLPGHHRYSP